MSYETIIFEKRDAICTITLNRAETGNRINSLMVQEISDACQSVLQDQEVRVAIITGAGHKAFCSGAESGKNDSDAETGVTMSVLSLPCPVIAAINGDAFGQGLELALACDIRIAADTSQFSLPQIKDGEIPHDGGTQLLSRVIGKAKALELILTADMLDAKEACEIGLINKAVPENGLMESVAELGRTMALQSPLAMKHAKEAVLKGLDMTLQQGLRLEGDLYFLLHTTEDRTEGIQAFLQKRQPEFKGK